MTRPQPRRLVRLLAAPLGAALALSVAACAPITTQREYAASDGIRVEVSDDVVLENLMIVAAAEGEPGAIQGAIRNDGADTQVTIGTQIIQVVSGDTILLGGPNGIEAVIDPVEAAPGANLPVTVAAGGSDAIEVPIPVIGTEFAEYADLAPDYANN